VAKTQVETGTLSINFRHWGGETVAKIEVSRAKFDDQKPRENFT
jgi:hypothetical protein